MCQLVVFSAQPEDLCLGLQHPTKPEHNGSVMSSGTSETSRGTYQDVASEDLSVGKVETGELMEYTGLTSQLNQPASGSVRDPVSKKKAKKD